jgi:hypothetical protein
MAQALVQYEHRHPLGDREDGYPDQIVYRLGVSPEAAVTAIEHGKADWGIYDVPFSPPPDRIQELLTRHAAQMRKSGNSRQSLASFSAVSLSSTVRGLWAIAGTGSGMPGAKSPARLRAPAGGQAAGAGAAGQVGEHICCISLELLAGLYLI